MLVYISHIQSPDHVQGCEDEMNDSYYNKSMHVSGISSLSRLKERTFLSVSEFAFNAMPVRT